jgi:hypothetical protein
MVTPRKTGRLGLAAAFGASAEVLAVELVEAWQGKPQFVCGTWGVELAMTMIGQNMTNVRSGQTVDQLEFFMAAKMTKEDGFFALKLAPAGHAGPP